MHTRRILAGAVSLAAAVSGVSLASTADAVDEPVYTFVSMPDFLNADIADTRLRAGRGWDRRDPVSTNRVWERAIDVVLDEVELEQADSVFVAGDLVNGHWGRDELSTRIFGRVNSLRTRRRAVLRAGRLYYGQWRRRFDQRDLTVYPGVGDHEYGDNDWPAGGLKYRLVPAHRRVWVNHFTSPRRGWRFAERPVGTHQEGTAYAKYLTPELMLVTVDTFSRSPREGMAATVRWGQLRWLREVLAQSTAETVIVQGHIPVLGPVRDTHSSALMLEGGAGSAFWRTLVEFDVDLYLSGEVHDVTAIAPDAGPVQISHGGHVGWGGANYLLGRVFADGRVELQIKRFDVLRQHRRRTVWQAYREWLPRGAEYRRGAAVTGTMALAPDGSVLERSGELSPYRQP